LEQRGSRQVGPVWNIVAEDEIHLLPSQHVDQHVTHCFRHAQEHLGEMLANGHRQFGADAEHQRRCDAQPNGFAVFALTLGDIASRLLDQLEDSIRPLVQQAPRLGRLDAARMPHQKSNAEILLDLPDLHPERGLSDVQLLGRTRHASGFDHAHQIHELTQVHGASQTCTSWSLGQRGKVH